MAEAPLYDRFRILASQLGARLFRQNAGMAWTSNRVERIAAPRTVRVGKGDVVLRHARVFHAGHAGLSDLGGWVPVVVTPEMVGTTLAVYAQVEVKDRASATQEQGDWIDAVNAAGGRAGVAKTEADLRKILCL